MPDQTDQTDPSQKEVPYPSPAGAHLRPQTRTKDEEFSAAGGPTPVFRRKTPLSPPKNPVRREIPAQAAVRIRAPQRCGECGYNLHGLPGAALCPECGHDPSEAALRPAVLAGDVWWARAVVAGLTLLLVSGAAMLGVTLYMRFRYEWGGAMTVLNFPGPKLWAAAMLQRNIGGSPGPWGIAATRFALLGLLGLWLVTAPRDSERLTESLFSVRRLLRWGSLACFGSLFGLLMGEDALYRWIDGPLGNYQLLLLSVVELPATTLLYLYLRKLAGDLRDTRLRKSLDVLAVAVPLCVGGAVVMILFGGYWSKAKDEVLQQVLVAGYGAACVTLGVVATAAVVRLVLTLVPAALGDPAAGPRPGTWRFVSKALWRVRLADGLRPGRLARLSVAAGLLGWLAVSWGLFSDVLSLRYRTGLGGNWPMLNVVGPKVWAVPMTTAFFPDVYYYDRYLDNVGLFTGAGGILAMLSCFWLVTIRLSNPLRDAGRPEGWFSPRRLARWGVVGLVGGVMGLYVGGIRPDILDLPTFIRASSETLPLTMFVEAPATLLVYLYLSSLARKLGDPGLGRRLSWAGLLACTLILGGNGLFLLSHVGFRQGWATNAVVAAYGVAAVTVGLWMTWGVLGLVKVLLTRAFETEPERQLMLFANH